MEILEQLKRDASLLQSRGLLVKFYAKSVEDKEESSKAGYQVFKTIDFINIKWDNDDSEVDRPVRSTLPDGIAVDSADEVPEHLIPDTIKYSRQWDSYKAGRGDDVIGIPIHVLFPNDPGKADTYKYMNILTVEQLSETPDATLQRVLKGLADKELARKFISKSQDTYAIEQQQAAMNNAREENDFLKQQLKDLQLQMSRLVEEKIKAAKSEGEAEEKTKKKKGADPDGN